MDFPAADSLLGNELLDKSGALLITGPQKIGKSLLATQLALCLADRQPFIGFDPTPATRRVLMLQAEVGEKRMQQRLRRQAAAFSNDVLGNVFNACTFSMLKLDDDASVGVLKETIEQHRPDIVVIDPLANFHCGDENVAQDILRVTSVLDRVRSLGPAVVLVHHHGKGSSERSNVGHKSRGSTALPGWYDTHLSLERAAERIRLQFELRHGEPPEDMILRLNPDTLLFEAQADEAAQIALVVAAIRERGPSQAEGVGEHCHRTRQWASDWLNRAVDQGRLERHGDRPVVFHFPGQPPETRVNVTADAIVVSTNTGDRRVWVDGEEVEGLFRN
jgi:hypothetical protein